MSRPPNFENHHSISEEIFDIFIKSPSNVSLTLEIKQPLIGVKQIRLSANVEMQNNARQNRVLLH